MMKPDELIAKVAAYRPKPFVENEGNIKLADLVDVEKLTDAINKQEERLIHFTPKRNFIAT